MNDAARLAELVTPLFTTEEFKSLLRRLDPSVLDVIPPDLSKLSWFDEVCDALQMRGLIRRELQAKLHEKRPLKTEDIDAAFQEMDRRQESDWFVASRRDCSLCGRDGAQLVLVRGGLSALASLLAKKGTLWSRRHVPLLVQAAGVEVSELEAVDRLVRAWEGSLLLVASLGTVGSAPDWADLQAVAEPPNEGEVQHGAVVWWHHGGTHDRWWTAARTLPLASDYTGRKAPVGASRCLRLVFADVAVVIWFGVDAGRIELDPRQDHAQDQLLLTIGRSVGLLAHAHLLSATSLRMGATRGRRWVAAHLRHAGATDRLALATTQPFHDPDVRQHQDAHPSGRIGWPLQSTAHAALWTLGEQVAPTATWAWEDHRLQPAAVGEEALLEDLLDRIPAALAGWSQLSSKAIQDDIHAAAGRIAALLIEADAPESAAASVLSGLTKLPPKCEPDLQIHALSAEAFDALTQMLKLMATTMAAVPEAMLAVLPPPHEPGPERVPRASLVFRLDRGPRLVFHSLRMSQSKRLLRVHGLSDIQPPSEPWVIVTDGEDGHLPVRLVERRDHTEAPVLGLDAGAAAAVDQPEPLLQSHAMRGGPSTGARSRWSWLVSRTAIDQGVLEAATTGVARDLRPLFLPSLTP